MPEIIDRDPDRGNIEPDDLDELQQRDPHVAAVLVEHNGPIEVQRVPARRAIMRSIPISATEPREVTGRDLRRARAVLVSNVGAFWVGATAADVGTGAMRATRWPVDTPLELTHAEPIFVRGDGTELTLSYVLEFWAD